DPAVVHAILDEALVCHVGFEGVGGPVVVPTIHARVADTLYLHGSPASRLLRTLATGVDVCVTATLVDGLVLAKSWFHHSLNYRSVMVFGRATAVTDQSAKTEALRSLVDHVRRDRSLASRPPSDKELAGTLVLALGLEECSAKSRTGPPIDDPADAELPSSTGVVPVSLPR
ncbi:MAG: pyridoxamine 5'-phosphate oxidase family protein, partial [Acidimicrobiales bacterium]